MSFTVVLSKQAALLLLRYRVNRWFALTHARNPAIHFGKCEWQAASPDLACYSFGGYARPQMCDLLYQSQGGPEGQGNPA
jgi:hypothetical protein